MKEKFYKKNYSTKKLKGVFGILLIVLAIASFFLWENYGRERFMYQDVIVLRGDVEAHKIIDKSMLGKMKIDKAGVIERAIADPQEIIGKQTLSAIPAGLQLSPKFFGDAAMSAGDGKYVMAVPDEWLYSFPQTLRRGDTVFFYPMIKKDAEEEAGYYDPNGEYITPETGALTSSGEALIKTSVAYVKDTSNREIVDVTPVRLDGVAALAKIEVVITEEQFKTLKASYEQGFQFIVMYE